MLQIHYIRAFFARSVLFLVIGLALVALVACSSGGDDPPNNGGTSSGGGGNSSIGGTSSDSGGGLDDLNLENAIVIKYNNGSDPVITNAFSEVTIIPTGENVVVRIPDASTTEYNFVISGTTSNGSLKFYGDVKKSLYLNGVSITNSKGPAINIQKSKRISVHLVDGTKNYLTDGANYDTPPNDEQAKGTFFSEGRLEFNKGNGSLEVKGKRNHAIVADNAIEVKYGNITVSESVNDGIHANDSIRVSGGNIIVKSVGDAIQSEKVPEGAPSAWLVFSGGTLNLETSGTKSHGIASEGRILIDSVVDIKISVKGNGSKGIKSGHNVKFSGGKVNITTSGTTIANETDPTDESNSTGVKLKGNLSIEGTADLTVTTTGENSKGISTDGDAAISGGKINIDANDDGLRVHGTLRITGGTGTIKSKKKDAIKADNWNGDKGSIITKSAGDF